MKKTLLTSAILIAMSSTAGLAHHPAEDMVDPEIYAMIEENISEVHLEMVFDDMGRDLTDAGASGEMSGDMGAETGGDMADSGAVDTREEMSSMEMSESRGSQANDNRGRQDR